MTTSTGEAATPSAVLGRIALRLRIGVTGHREIESPERIAEAIDTVIDRITERVPARPSTPMLLTVVSPLAEGADRLVARRVLRVTGACLEVPLPLEVGDYEDDFDARGSVEEFRELLHGARLVTPPPAAGSRQEAYERVGYYVVDRCDVLIAIWEGKGAGGRGGTARIVNRARGRGVPLFWINSRADHEIIEERASTIASGIANEAHAYNEALGEHELAEALATERRHLIPVNRTEVEELQLGELADWMTPFLVRADQLAVTYRRRYDRGTLVIVASAATGVLSATLHAVHWHHEKALLYIEAALLLVVAVQFLWGRYRMIHPRWISYRFLAERFRSAFYLALADMGQRIEGGYDSLEGHDDREEWVRRAFGEVWDARPDVDTDAARARAVGAFLARSWLGEDDEDGGSGQIAYHRRQSQRLRRSHERISFALLTIFTTVLVVAALHPFVDHERTAEVLTGASLFLPAVGAAIAALNADREYSRHAERYSQVAGQLTHMRRDLESVRTLKRLHEVTDRTEQIMLEENRDWFGVRRFHDFEPHV